MTTDNVELSAETQEMLDQHNLRSIREIEEEEYADLEELQADIWEWENIRTVIDQMEKDIPPWDNRRVIVPINISQNTALSRTLFIGIQTASPGDSPTAHRHGGNALRFTIDGDQDMKSTVGGEVFPMDNNDLLTIPQWAWHEHENESENEVTWLDVHDTPLFIDSLRIGNAFEEDDDPEPADKPGGYHQSLYGDARPVRETNGIRGPFEGIREPTPIYRFRWVDIDDSITFAETNNPDAYDQHDGILLEYKNPATGSGPIFPTYRVYAQRLIGGDATRSHRHNSTEVYHVIEGSGVTVVDNTELHWANRDIFVVPPNRVHFHNPDGNATLLKLTDKALLEALNFYYEKDVEK